MNNKLLIKWIVGVGAAVIAILGVSLVFLILKKPEETVVTGTVTENGIAQGEENNAETLAKLDLIVQAEPVVGKLPLTVEFYSEDLSRYTKYIVSYALDDSEKGFHLIYKDYTGEGVEKISAHLTEMGMKLGGMHIEYEDLTQESLGGHAE